MHSTWPATKKTTTLACLEAFGVAEVAIELFHIFVVKVFKVNSFLHKQGISKRGILAEGLYKALGAWKPKWTARKEQR